MKHWSDAVILKKAVYVKNMGIFRGDLTNISAGIQSLWDRPAKQKQLGCGVHSRPRLVLRDTRPEK